MTARSHGAWGSFAAGQRTEIDFVVRDADMKAYQRLSGDDSLSHTDLAFCLANGIAERVVYGGLLIAVLSRFLGRHLPGQYGLSNRWTINFHRPLHVEERAVLRGEVAHVSAGTRTLDIRFQIATGDLLVADGSVLTAVLSGPGSEPSG